MKNWLQETRALLLRFRIEQPIFLVAPEFRLTIYILWILAIAGLLYGNVFFTGLQSQSLSLLLSGIAALGAVFLLLLKDPWARLKYYLMQTFSLVLVIVCGVLVALTYSILNTQSTQLSMKLIWSIGSVLVGVYAIRSVRKAFFDKESGPDRMYTAQRTAPLLTGLLIINYLLWVAKDILSVLR